MVVFLFQNVLRPSHACCKHFNATDYDGRNAMFGDEGFDATKLQNSKTIAQRDNNINHLNITKVLFEAEEVVPKGKAFCVNVSGSSKKQ